ncbi:MAG TPA: GntR family transcriptional regulator [Gaiellaceae bacterium]|nr:GntR family transcriptional regulator [Gaiellaceae bacterium]
MSVFLRPPSAQEAVLSELRRRIAAGELRPGAKLVADQIGLELGVSRVPVREALKVLEGEGQVVTEPHRGYFMAELSLDDLREIYRMRELLEAEALRSAVERIDAEGLAEVEAILGETDAASERGELAEYAAANRRFHFAVYSASGRAPLVRTIGQLWDASEAYRALFANREAHRAAAARDHRAILRALRSRDAGESIRAHDAHRERACVALERLLT